MDDHVDRLPNASPPILVFLTEHSKSVDVVPINLADHEHAGPEPGEDGWMAATNYVLTQCPAIPIWVEVPPAPARDGFQQATERLVRLAGRGAAAVFIAAIVSAIMLLLQGSTGKRLGITQADGSAGTPTEISEVAELLASLHSRALAQIPQVVIEDRRGLVSDRQPPRR